MMMKILLFLLIFLFKTFAIEESQDVEKLQDNIDINNGNVHLIIDKAADKCDNVPPTTPECSASGDSEGADMSTLVTEANTDAEDVLGNGIPELKGNMKSEVTTEKKLISDGAKEGNNTNGEVIEGKESVENTTMSEGNSTVKVKITKQVVCNETEERNITDVQVINATQILKLLHIDLNITGKATAATCYLVYFFSPYCPFSVKGSPYVNALARSVKNVQIFGLDSVEHHNLNSRYGVAGTPSLVLFHNGLTVGRYNASEYSTSSLMSFIHHYTDQKIDNITVTSADFEAILPSEIIHTTPYVIYICWIFLLGDIIWFFLRSRLYARLTEIFVNNWREAEAQHEHED